METLLPVFAIFKRILIVVVVYTMDMVLAGQIVGRIFLSYLLVLFLMLVASRFSLRRAFFHTHRWYGFVLLTLIFLLGISSRLVFKGMV